MGKSLKHYYFVWIVFFVSVITCICSANIFKTTIDNVSAYSIPEDQPNRIVLTTEQTDSSYTYFDQLVNAAHTSWEINYLNMNGELVKTYKAIQRIGELTGQASGNAILELTEDMQLLADTGKFYAYAQAGLLALDRDNRNYATIYLNSDGIIKSATSNKVYYGGAYSPDWVQTDRINLINGNSVVKFNFDTRIDNSETGIPYGFLMFEPSVSFGLTIDEITTNLIGGTVYNGQKIYLDASTILDNINSYTNLMEYYRNAHKIEWEFVSGSGLATIENGYLNVIGEAGTIQLRAKCKSDTNGTGYTYSEIVTYQIGSTSEYLVNLTSNFYEGLENIAGTGITAGDSAIYFNIKSGYSLIGAKDENGDAVAVIIMAPPGEGVSYAVPVTSNKTINILLMKNISIQKIIVENKQYDAKVNATIKEVILSSDLKYGVSLSNNLSANFDNSNVGENKTIIFSGSISLSGDNAPYYNFSTTLPTTTANIEKRDILVIAHAASKQYGDADDDFSYTYDEGALGGDSLLGNLSRESGESVGTYRILQGGLGNGNYNVIFHSNIFTIKRREIKIKNVNVAEKVYDRTTTVNNFTYDYTGSTQEDIDNDVIGFINDNARLTVSAEFADANVGETKEVILTASILGIDKSSYEIVYPESITGKITAKNITITAEVKEKIYGDVDPQLTYTCAGLIAGDFITGELTRVAGENVGEYEIQIGTLSATNYQIESYTSANLTISQRAISIKIDNFEKTYGETDPTFTYQITSGNIVEGLPGLGLTLKRTAGETVGDYSIIKDGQENINYLIALTEGTLGINQKSIIIRISAEQKQFDSTVSAAILVEIIGALETDNIHLATGIIAKFSDKNNGDRSVSYYEGEELITQFTLGHLAGENIASYNPEFVVSYEGKILPRGITVFVANDAVLLKQYGNLDEQIKYSVENLPDGEQLLGSLSREPGEEVGDYVITRGSLTNANNPNYAITFNNNNKKYSIEPRIVKIMVDDKQITYGDNEGNIIYYLSEETPLQTGVLLQNILIGAATREQGNNSGEYNYLIGTIQVRNGQTHRYTLQFDGGTLTINKRDLTIQVEDKTKTYGNADPLLTYVITNGSLLNSAELTLSRNNGENAGSYPISATLSNSNYNFSFLPGTLTITPAPITIKANSTQKQYGYADPVFTYYLLSGTLKFNDTMSGIFAGTLGREVGEIVDTYNILQGNLIANANYLLTFEGNIFTIIPREITVTANAIQKFLDEENPTFTYRVSPSLVNGDILQGALSVETVSGVGEYNISIGTLDGGDNYNITFVGAKLSVVRRKLNVVVGYMSKQYDSTANHDALTCTINGDIKEGHTKASFNIQLACDLGINVGKYAITATVLNPQEYEVTITNNYFEILKRVVIISPNGRTVIYGDSIPSIDSWGYSVVGEIYNNEVTFQLTCNYSYRAGSFAIGANVQKTDNYSVTVIPATLKINKKEITVIVSNYQKEYGQPDPTFTYQLDESELINEDRVTGAITRIPGKNVGLYSLVCSLINSNYSFVMNDANLTITPKELQVKVSALNKAYDGETTALLGLYKFTGLIKDDDVEVIYTSAEFESPEIGNDKNVSVDGLRLAGADAQNYTMVATTDFVADIANAYLDNGSVRVTAENGNANLKLDSTLEYAELNPKDLEKFLRGKIIDSAYKLNVKNNNQTIDSGKVKVEMAISLEEVEKLKLYKLNEDGSIEEIEFSYENGVATFITDGLGRFVFASDKDYTLMYALIGVGSGLTLLGGIITWVVLYKKKNAIKIIKTPEGGKTIVIKKRKYKK